MSEVTEGEVLPEETEATDADEVKAESSEEAKESKGPPESIPYGKFAEKVNKWKTRVDEANEEAERKERENEALRREVELLKLQTGAKKTGVPDRLDYDSEEEFERAHSEYVRAQAAEQLEQWDSERRKKEQADKVAENLDTAMQAHYQRAAEFAGEDFDEAENRARKTLGDTVCQQVMMNFDNSEQVLYALGNDAPRAERIQKLIQSNPMEALIDLTRLADSLKVTPKTPEPPDPDEAPEGAQGSAVTWDQRIEKMRDSVHAGKAKMSELLSLKKQARGEGWAERT